MKNNKPYEEACTSLNRKPLQLSDFDFLPEGQRVSAFGEHKIITCIEVKNKGWKPDWTDWDQYKYLPYFYIPADKHKVSGAGFSYLGFGYDSTFASVGSRLYCKSADIAKQIGEECIEYYNEYIKM